MRKMHISKIGLALLVAAFVARADTLIERYGEAYRGLPDVLNFDCSPDAGPEMEFFNRTFRVPRNFEPFELPGRFFTWRVPLNDGFVTVHFSSIRLESSQMLVAESLNWPAVSEPSENRVGVRIVLHEPDPDDRYGGYELFLSRGDQYMSIDSIVPIDWQSLMACFE